MTKPQQKYILKWDNYFNQFTDALDHHRANDEFVDVSLLCEGRKISAHKLVLSSCSAYFKEVFTENPHPHPLIIFKFIKYEDLQAIIKFMYRGEVDIEPDDLQSFLETAKLLAVHGLGAEVNENIPSHTNVCTKNFTSQIPNPNLNVPDCSLPTSFSAATHKQQQMQSQQTNEQNTEAQRICPPSLLRLTHTPPTCSQNANKKRKMTDALENDENNIRPLDGMQEQESGNAETIGSSDPFKISVSEYILGQNAPEHQPSVSISLQEENNENLDCVIQDITHIKTEYDSYADSDIEEKYTPMEDSNLTMETTHVTNVSACIAQAGLDFEASGSNAGALDNKGDVSGILSELAEIKDKINQLHGDVFNIATMVAETRAGSGQVFNEMVKLARCAAESNVLIAGISGMQSVPFKFPVRDVDDLQNLEDSINPENVNDITQTIKLLLMGSIANNIEKILNAELILSHNYDGRNGKKALKDYTSFMGVMFEAVNKTVPEFEMELRTAMRKIKNKLHKRHSRSSQRDYVAVVHPDGEGATTTTTTTTTNPDGERTTTTNPDGERTTTTNPDGERITTTPPDGF